MCDKCDDSKYDLETKQNKQASEIVELKKRIQDVKGYVNPFLIN